MAHGSRITDRNVGRGTLRGSMLLGLVSLGAIFALSTFVTFQQIQEHQRYGRAISLAGRERTLIKKMLSQADLLVRGDETQRPLVAQTQVEFETSLRALRQGDGGVDIAAPSADIQLALDNIAGQWVTVRDQATLVATSPPGSAESQAASAALPTSAYALLPEIDHTVSLYEDALSAKVTRTQEILIALAVLGALVGAASWWHMLHRVARPLSQLADGAVRLGAGELDYRVPINGVSEVAVVGREFNAMVDRLEEALSTERERARHDSLTGTLNHAAIADRLQALIAGSPASLAICLTDVDGMKATNDTYGHQAGDAVLVTVARALSRDGAVVARYGGDEFLALLPGADRARAELYRAAVEEELSRADLKDPPTGAHIPVIASLGLAVYPDEARTYDDLLQLADNAMYVAKRQRLTIAEGGNLMRPLGGERAAQMVGELVPLLTSPGDLSEKLRLVSQRLSIGAGYDGVHFELFELDSTAAFATNTFARLPDSLLEAWNEEQRSIVGGGMTHLLRETQQPLIMDDLATDPRLTDNQRALLVQAGLKSGMVVALVWQDRIIGTLSVGSKQADAFSPSDAQFVTAVANQVTAIARMAGLVDQLEFASSRLARGQEETVLMLAAAAEAHDHTTGRHLQSVRALSEALARELGYEAEQARALGMAAVLHDIGKIRVAESILISPTQLSDEQWRAMKQHTIWGAEFLSARHGFELAAQVARAHHERWDGTGYPAGLAGDDIPEAAAIVSVADSYDAMTSSRPYRASRPAAWAVHEIEANAGTQFSPRVVDALLRLHARGELEQHTGYRDEDAAGAAHDQAA